MADIEGNNEKNTTGDDGPKASPQVQAASRRFQQTQAQVDEVVGIMRTNVEKVLERDTKLSELVSKWFFLSIYLIFLSLTTSLRTLFDYSSQVSRDLNFLNSRYFELMEILSI